jgi:hypothetical protein
MNIACFASRNGVSNEKDTLFPRGHCASGDSEWALPTRIGTAGKRNC